MSHVGHQSVQDAVDQMILGQGMIELEQVKYASAKGDAEQAATLKQLSDLNDQIAKLHRLEVKQAEQESKAKTLHTVLTILSCVLAAVACVTMPALIPLILTVTLASTISVGVKDSKTGGTMTAMEWVVAKGAALIAKPLGLSTSQARLVVAITLAVVLALATGGIGGAALIPMAFTTAVGSTGVIQNLIATLSESSGIMKGFGAVMNGCIDILNYYVKEVCVTLGIPPEGAQIKHLDENGLKTALTVVVMVAFVVASFKVCSLTMESMNPSQSSLFAIIGEKLKNVVQLPVTTLLTATFIIGIVDTIGQMVSYGLSGANDFAMADTTKSAGKCQIDITSISLLVGLIMANENMDSGMVQSQMKDNGKMTELFSHFSDDAKAIAEAMLA